MERDDPKELGKKPRGKKSRIRDAGRKKTPGAVQQAQRWLSLRQEEARSRNNSSWSERANGWNGGIPPIAEMKGRGEKGIHWE